MTPKDLHTYACAWGIAGRAPRLAEFPPEMRIPIGGLLDFDMMLKASDGMADFRAAGGFAIPCAEGIETVAKHSQRIVEIGAGGALWARLVSAAGVDVIATDLRRWPGVKHGKHYPILKADGVKAVRRFPTRDVMVVWPPYRERWCFDAASLIAPGRLLFYVGEGAYGCCGCHRLHDLLATGFDEIDSAEIPQWGGLRDRLTVYRRRAEPKPRASEDGE